MSTHALSEAELSTKQKKSSENKKQNEKMKIQDIQMDRVTPHYSQQTCYLPEDMLQSWQPATQRITLAQDS